MAAKYQPIGFKRYVSFSSEKASTFSQASSLTAVAATLLTVEPLKGMASSIVAVKNAFHSRFFQGLAVIIHVLGRRIFVFVTKETDNWTSYVLSQADGFRLPSPKTNFTRPA